jgi:hypothetical protein
LLELKMTEKYPGRAENIAAPARRGFAIAASDTTDLAAETRAIYVGTAGDLAAVLSSGDEVTFAGVGAGTLLPIRCRRVKATGTTAGQLVGLY